MISVSDPQLPDSVQITASSLLRSGRRKAGIHLLSAVEASRLGITGALARELVTKGVAQLNDKQGRMLRPQTTVATRVEIFDNGDIEVELPFDLIP